METLELALELRRCGYGSAGERLGFDLYHPYNRRPGRRGSSARCCSGRFIDSVAGKIDDAALREAQQAKDAVRAYELVYAAARSVSSVVLGIDVGTSGVKGSRAGRRGVGAGPGAGRLNPPVHAPSGFGRSRTPMTGGKASQSVLAEFGAAVGRAAGIGLSGQMHGLVALGAGRSRAPPGDPVERTSGRRAECQEIEDTIGLERLIALTGNRAA